jgi:hypothetical protein
MDSPSAERPTPTAVPPPAATAAWVAGAIAALWLVIGLSDPGLLSLAELPVLDRVAAAMGEARSNLVRSPWLPDELRRLGVAAFGDELGVRVPHAVAVAATAAAIAWLAVAHGLGRLGAAVAVTVALSMPALAVAGRTATGNPFGECFAAWAIVGAIQGSRAASVRGAAIAWGLAAVSLGASVASSGLVPGGLVPLVAAAALVSSQTRVAAASLAALWLVLAVVAVSLVWRQADGYIPLLGAAKDLELVDKPQLRRFTGALADLGHQSFVWLPLGLVGIAMGRDRRLTVFAGTWLLGGLAVMSAWSLVYGRVDVPLRVPVALLAAAAVSAIADPQIHRNARRAAVVVGALSVLVMAKDLELLAEEIAMPLHVFAVNEYPAEALQTAARLGRGAKLVALAIVVGFVVSPGAVGDGRLARVVAGLLARVPERARAVALPALVMAAAGVCAWTLSRTLVADTAAKLSPKRMLDTFATLVDRGALEPTLAMHRVRDRGLAYYGPEKIESLGNRRDVFQFLESETPRAALLRTLDLPAAYQQHRAASVPLFVLDDSHATLRLVSNVLPDGVTDRNRIPEVLSDAPFELANPTFVQFEQFVEVIGWEVDGPIVRGRKHTLQLSLHVLRPLPGGAKIHARFLGGRLSRINGDPQPIAEDLYPGNLWRKDDYILHRFEFEAPLLEIIPGEYDFVVGIARGENKNFEISLPEGTEGEYGVKIEDSKRAFAKIGRVQVW